MKVSYLARIRMANLKEEIEKEEREDRLYEEAIHKYSICPYCGEDLDIVLLPSEKNTFDGIQKICKTHGLLYEQGSWL